MIDRLGSIAAAGAALLLTAPTPPPAGGATTAKLWRLDCARQGKKLVDNLNRGLETCGYSGVSRS
ncbi:MAG: hypothetical protein M3R64_03045 [Pseudomonadota bacterium]|nr:hypothetical protein [Pseudomonadota bacterium]